MTWAYENLLLRGIQDKNTPYTYNIVTEWREKFEIFNAKNKMKKSKNGGPTILQKSITL